MKWWFWALVLGGGAYILYKRSSDSRVEEIAKTIPECRTCASSRVTNATACFGSLSSSSVDSFLATGSMSSGGCVEKLLKEVARQGVPVDKMHIPIGNGQYVYTTR